MRLEVRLRAFLLALSLAALGLAAHGDGQLVTLKGRLSGTEDARETGIFILDADNLGLITLNVGQASYLADYLDGCIGSRVVVTIAPDGR